MAGHHVGLYAGIPQAIEEGHGAGEDGELVRDLFVTCVVQDGFAGGTGDLTADAALSRKDHGPFHATGHG
jgi:hypothetical protein